MRVAGCAAALNDDVSVLKCIVRKADIASLAATTSIAREFWFEVTRGAEPTAVAASRETRAYFRAAASLAFHDHRHVAQLAE